MSLLRPEVAAALYRWREALVGALFLAVGLRWALTSFGALFLIGCGFAAAGAALIAAGIQRGRFRAGGGGAGVVDVDERRITYFGPFGGGAVAVEDLNELGVDGAHNWHLTDASGQILMIPMTAEGADALFDAFTALPDLHGSDLVAAARRPAKGYTVVWSRAHSRLH